MEIPNEIVGKYETVDPETEEILFDGYLLKSGMVVVIEDVELRWDVVDDPDDRHMYYMMVMNRWCRISDVYSTRNHKVEFIATYADGFIVKRITDTSKAWIVKVDSKPDYSLLKRVPEPIVKTPDESYASGPSFDSTGTLKRLSELTEERQGEKDS